MVHTFISGFLLSISLIFVIGAQNAFILRQGIRVEYRALLCTICAFSDSVLIFVGVFGLEWLSDKVPIIVPVMRYAGAAFLLVYGLKSFWLAYRSNAVLDPLSRTGGSRRTAIITCLVLTWLNPHVYLDTVLLLGSLAAHYPDNQLAFALGASVASWMFFFTLGFGARVLTPFFTRPYTWKILECVIGCLMCGLALNLVSGAI